MVAFLVERTLAPSFLPARAHLLVFKEAVLVRIQVPNYEILNGDIDPLRCRQMSLVALSEVEIQEVV